MVKKKAFTLIEILIVIFIIGILSATLIPRIGNARKKTEEAVELIKANRNIACTEGLDDLCDNNGSSNGGGDTSNGVYYNGGDISVCREGKCITMMDRNMGATKAGTGCSSSDTGACGYHYQWGNNYGFPKNGRIATSNIQVDASSYGPGNYYSRATFILSSIAPYDWSSKRNDNLWGGRGDTTGNNRGYDVSGNISTNVTGRQGPCPDGYHIPSQGERGMLLKYWAAYYTGTTSNTIKRKGSYPLQYFSNKTGMIQFQEDFKIPFAGYRSRQAANIIDLEPVARLWSSSSDGTNARYFSIDSSYARAYVRADESYHRANASSIRCFKN